MSFVLRPWQLFFLILSGWVNRQQQEIIEFQNAQIRALIEKMGRKRILLLTDDQPRIVAVRGKALGLDNQIIDPGGEVGQEIGEVQCTERLGGMLRFYYRDAA